MRALVRFRNFLALVLGAACIVGAAPRGRAALAAASRGQDAGVQQPIANGSPLDLSGIVLRDDGTTPIANVRLRLREIDTGTIVGLTTSDATGAFAFGVPQSGLYVVEALDETGVQGVSEQITFDRSPVRTRVVLRRRRGAAAFFGGTAFQVISTAGGAGIGAWFLGGHPASPER